MKEMNILRSIMLAAHTVKSTLFRANVGTGWTGQSIKRVKTNQTVAVSKGDIVIRGARPFSTGLPAGFSDLFGWTEVEITSDHIGQTLPVFTLAEVKTDKGRATPEQRNMIDNAERCNCIAGVVRSDADFQRMIAEYKQSRQEEAPTKA